MAALECSARAKPEPSISALARAVVLVVDDGDANVLLLQRLLTRAGAATVEGVTDPRRAAQTYLRLNPDLVLLDLHMPHMDGLAVLKALKALTPPDAFVPIVVLTADATIEAKNQALAAGAKDFLTKPFEHREVLLRAHNLLETRRLHLQLRRHNQRLEDEICQTRARERRAAEVHARRQRRLRKVLEGDDLTMVYQPIINLRTDRISGFEALARFAGHPQRPPDQWFAEAAELGIGTELELLAAQKAITELPWLPDGTYLSVNVSPQTALSPRLADIINPVADRIVIELTEHEAVTEYGTLAATIGHLRQAGTRLAVDDAGSGYSSLQHILRLKPDIIKLDIALTRGIHTDAARRALGVALVQFGHDIGAEITAEGIEELAELEVLRHIGAHHGQGYLLGRPAPPASRSGPRPPSPARHAAQAAPT